MYLYSFTLLILFSLNCIVGKLLVADIVKVHGVFSFLNHFVFLHWEPQVIEMLISDYITRSFTFYSSLHLAFQVRIRFSVGNQYST